MPAAEPIAFEAALAEIETIVATLERGGPDLNGALASYGRGVALLATCQGMLDQAERSVALLTGVDDAGQPITTPFDAAATTAPALPPITPPVMVQPAPAPPPPPPAEPPPREPGTIVEAPF